MTSNLTVGRWDLFRSAFVALPPEIQAFRVSLNQFTGEFPALPELPSLTDLWCADNQLTGNFLSGATSTNLPNLKSLVIYMGTISMVRSQPALVSSKNSWPKTTALHPPFHPIYSKITTCCKNCAWTKIESPVRFLPRLGTL
jgi:hypothetical protein